MTDTAKTTLDLFAGNMRQHNICCIDEDDARFVLYSIRVPSDAKLDDDRRAKRMDGARDGGTRSNSSTDCGGSSGGSLDGTPSTVRITVGDGHDTNARVLGEDRSVTITHGVFEDQ